MKVKTGSIHNIPPKSQIKTYLMGFVAGIIYHDGHEWLLTKSGAWEDLHSTRPENSSHIWTTREQAEKIAKANTSEFKSFTRGYIYETPNPKNAEGMEEIARDNSRLERIFV